MESKSLTWMAAALGSTLGGLIPTIWGAGFLSFSSLIFSALGGIAGIWVAFKLTH